MSDRSNRVTLTVTGGLLAGGGALSACLGAGVFGTARGDRDVFDRTLIGWWDEGGWMSFATVVAIGVVALLIGLRLVVSLLRTNDGLARTSTMTVTGSRGEATLKATVLAHGLERDLEQIPDVHGAAVRIFGSHPDLDVRAVLEVGDDADLEALPALVDEALGRASTTVEGRIANALVTVKFKDVDKQRQLA